MNIAEIIARIPHRYPFLLVDKVLEVGPDSITALKNVTFNENFFVGHFPEHPIMPGVLILEALAQTAAILVNADHKYKDKVVYFTTIEKAQFRKPVVPGDTLILQVKIEKARGSFWKFEGTALVNNERVANSSFTATQVDK